MKVIALPQYAGKTTALIRAAANFNGYIVVESMTRASEVASMARALDVQINFPLTFDEVLVGRFNAKGCSPLHFDNVDDLLRRLARGAEVASMTVTTPAVGGGGAVQAP